MTICLGACNFCLSSLCPESLALWIPPAAQNLPNFPGYMKGQITFHMKRGNAVHRFIGVFLMMIGPSAFNGKTDKSRHLHIHIYFLLCMPLTDIGR